MKGDKKIIDILNELLAGELTAVDQYLIHAEMYADMGFQRLADKALHESDHERQHARALIQRILFLEGTPNLAKREALKIGNEVSETAFPQGVETADKLTRFVHALDDTRPVTAGINVLLNVYAQKGIGV